MKAKISKHDKRKSEVSASSNLATKLTKKVAGCLKIKSQETSLATIYGRRTSLTSAATLTTISTSTTMDSVDDKLSPGVDANTNEQKSETIEKQNNVATAIKFDSVEIRYYPIVLSENPACHGPGPSIEIGWDYFEHPIASKNKVHVDDYERMREKQRRRRWKQMRLTCQERYKLLERMGYNNNEIMRAALKVKRIQLDRAESMTITKNQERRQERVESLIRKIMKKHTKELEQLYSNAQAHTHKKQFHPASSRHKRLADGGATNSFYDKFAERKQKKHKLKRRKSHISRQ